MRIPPIPGTKWRQSLPLFIAAAVIIIADQVTKALIRTNMDLHQSIPEEGRFRLTYSTNSGSIFGLSLDSTFLIVMAPIVIAIILWMYFYYLPSGSRLLRLGFGSVLGGAVGNLIDRVRLGSVTDFIDVRLWGDFHWATFNVADAAISVGIVILMYCFIFLGLAGGEKPSPP